MGSNKKSSLPLIIGICSLLFALYFGASLGMTMTEMQSSGLQGSELLNAIIQGTSDRMSGKLFSGWFFDQNVLRSMLLMVAVWFIAIAMLFSGKKNYIRGKEYGTARWGTQADIRDLFASTIMAKQLKDAKMLRTNLGTKLLRKKRFKEWKRSKSQLTSGEMKLLSERQGQIMQNLRQTRDLQEQKDLASEQIEVAVLDPEKGEAQKAALHSELEKAKKKAAVVKVMQNLQSQETSERKRQVSVDCDKMWLDLWEPDRLKKSYDDRIKEINELYNQGIAVTASTKEQEIQKAKQEYTEGLERFRDYESQKYKIEHKYAYADMLLTKTERICMYNYMVNLNILVVGGAGCGKSRTFCMPNLLQGHSSFVVTDPKGELLEKSGKFLKSKGYTIRVLNLDEKKDSDCYNPFKYIHPDRQGYEERVLTLVTTLIANTTKDKSSSQDPFWENAEKLFLQALFFFVVDGFAEENRNMNTVLDLIEMLEIEEERDKKNSRLDIFAEEFERKLNEADKEDHKAGSENSGVKAWKEFRSKAAGKTAKSIVITAVARLSPFRTKGIRRIFEYDDMQLERLGEEKTAVFVVVPPVDDTFNSIAGMLFTQMFQELQYCALQVHKHDGQRCPVTVRFILDEFATTCVIPNFTKILAYARSLGIGIAPVIQSIEQLKTTYEKDWGSIVDNCSSLLYLGGDTTDASTKFISDLLGKGTYDKRTTGRSRGKSGSSSENFDVIGRELMTPDEVRRLPKDECILIVNSRYPFKSKKNDYLKHPNYCFTSDAAKENSYYHTRIRDNMPEKPETEQTETASVSLEDWKELVDRRIEETKNAIDREVPTVQLETDGQAILGGATRMLERLSAADVRVDDGEEFGLQEAFEEEKQAQAQSEMDIASLIDDETDPVTMEQDAETIAAELSERADSMEPADISVDDGENTVDPDEVFTEDDAEDDDISELRQNIVADDLADQVSAQIDSLNDAIDDDMQE